MSIDISPRLHFGDTPIAAEAHLDKAASDISKFEEVSRSPYCGLGDTVFKEHAVRSLYGNLQRAKAALHVAPFPARITPAVRHFALFKRTYAALESILSHNAYHFNGCSTDENIKRALPSLNGSTSAVESHTTYYDALSHKSSLDWVVPSSPDHTIDSAGNWCYKSDASSA